MLPRYLQSDYQKSMERASAELKSQMPYYARVQADAHEDEQKRQRAEEGKIRQYNAECYKVQTIIYKK